MPQPQTRTDINASALLWLAESTSTVVDVVATAHGPITSALEKTPRILGQRRSVQPPQQRISTSARRTVVPQPQTRTDINASALLWLAEPKSTISPSINSKSKWGHESYDPDQARAMRPSIDTLPAALRRRLERGGVAPRTVV